MIIVLVLMVAVISYLIGSTPIGVLAARWIGGVDVRAVGSGRTGTTNVYRAAGRWGAVLTTFGDVFKGILPVWIARLLTARLMPQSALVMAPWMEAIAGIAAITGHNWSVFLKFKGGAGTITTMGILAAMNLPATVILIVMSVIALLISHMASVASLTIAFTMGLMLCVFSALGLSPWGYVVFGFVGGAMTTYALRPNIVRILKKQERQLTTSY